MTDHRNLVPKIGLSLIGTWIGYAVLMNALGRTTSEMSLGETAFLLSLLLTTLGTILIAAVRAHRAGSWAWFLAVIFVWPLSYLYTLVINKSE